MGNRLSLGGSILPHDSETFLQSIDHTADVKPESYMATSGMWTLPPLWASMPSISYGIKIAL
jgi:hypothetical protein